MSGAVHTPLEADLLRALEALAGAAAMTPNFASPLMLKGAFEAITKANGPNPSRDHSAAGSTAEVNARLRQALRDIEYLTHTHCTQKYALDGVNAIRDVVESTQGGAA